MQRSVAPNPVNPPKDPKLERPLPTHGARDVGELALGTPLGLL